MGTRACAVPRAGAAVTAPGTGAGLASSARYTPWMLHLVHNPVAGRGRVREAAATVAGMLGDRGVDARVWTTDRPGHATAIAAALPGDATVVAVGGDGTVHEVARSCIGTARTLGVVPIGSGDDFAHALGIGRTGLRDAVEVLVRGRVRTIDTGVCNGVPFVNAAGVGFDAEVGARVARAPARWTGVAAYLWAVGVSLRELTHRSVRVEADGAVVHDGACLLASCQNGPRTGGSFRFVPDASLDDGLLDLLIAGRIGRAGVANLLPRVMMGRHLGHPRVRHVRATRVRMTWGEPRGWHTEGEVHPSTGRFDVRIVPASLRVRAP